MSPSLRAFFAVPVCAALRTRLGEVTAPLRTRSGGVRWVRPDNLHVTLRFLGDVCADAVPDLAAAVRVEVASMPAFACPLKGVELFPSARRPRVVAVGLVDDGRLAALAAAVERGVRAAGHAPDPRGFRAHLTLGRVRDPRPPDVWAAPGLAGAELVVDRVVLFHSDLRREGAVYDALEVIPLSGP